MKKYVWGFPGIGKTTVNSGFRVVDADYNTFKFVGVDNSLLHGQQIDAGLNPDFPQNYFDFIASVDADIVFVNCHLSLFRSFDDVLVVYPDKSLKEEYLQRYTNRGDNISFVSYMEIEFDAMVDFIDGLDVSKIKVFDCNVFMQNVIESEEFKMNIMTKNEIVEQLQRAIDLKVLHIDDYINEIVCDATFAVDGTFIEDYHKADVLVDAVLDGTYKLDIDLLIKACNTREAEIEKEKVISERRGGLSREALEDKIMQGIVNGALGIRYAEIAPYSHGYQVAFGSDRELGSTYGAKVSWNCYCNLFDVPKTITDSIENGAKTLNIAEIIEAINDTERDVITSFVPEKETDFKRAQGYTRGSIASVMDVHAGKGLDGIVKHHYHGDYSSYTPCAQNSLVEALVCLKGFCLDCINTLDVGAKEKEKIVDYLKKHGTDISTHEKLSEWIKANPKKCGLEENRVVKDEYYVVQCDVHTKDEPYYKSAYEANSFDNFDDAMTLARELCDDIVGLAKEHEKTGDVLDDICVLRVVENEAAFRVEEEVVFIQEYNEQEHQISNVDAVISDAKDRVVETDTGVAGKDDVIKE